MGEPHEVLIAQPVLGSDSLVKFVEANVAAVATLHEGVGGALIIAPLGSVS